MDDFNRVAAGGIEMKKHRIIRSGVALLLLAVAIGCPGLVLGSEKYPSKTVKVLIPWGSGGGTDTTIRSINQVMPKYFPEKLILVNQVGGHGTIAMTALVNSKPDGYTLCITSAGPTTSVPHLEKLQYGLEDYVPVIQLTDVPSLLVTHPDSGFKSFADVLAYTKKNPNETLKIAISGVGAVGSHIPSANLTRKSGIKFATVPFPGAGDAAVSVMGKHIPLGTLDLMSVDPKIKSGHLIPLGAFTTKRLSSYPNVPTLAELGYDVVASAFQTIIVPKGTPEAVINTLHDAFKKGLDDAEFKETAKNLNLGIAYLDGKAARERINREYKELGVLLEYVGMLKK
jgi:tripartite-type tricarboxylate transporter receptor subunit TctC